MKIPTNIQREHIFKALNEIDKNGVPEEREPTKFNLVYNSKRYPPMYVISIANLFANGEELSPSDFGGSKETSDFLKKLGFKIKEEEDALINSFSWTIYSPVIAVKEMDKSAFLHNGTGIPQDIRHFFNTNSKNEVIDTKKPIALIYNDVQYDAHIVFDTHGRTRLLWNGELGGVIRRDFQEEYNLFKDGLKPNVSLEMKFTKYNDDSYEINVYKDKSNFLPTENEIDYVLLNQSLDNKEYLIGAKTRYYVLTLKNPENQKPPHKSYMYRVLLLDNNEMVRTTYVSDFKDINLLTAAKMEGLRLLIESNPNVAIEDVTMVHYKQDRPNAKPWQKESFSALKELFNKYKKQIEFNGIYETVKEDLESQEAEEEGYYKDGATSYYYGKRYERNPQNRAKAIEIHGVNCIVCGFNFEKVYGERGRDYIEIHHVKPLSLVKEEVLINPETDLVPLCSNCHRMVHRRKDRVLTVEELRGLIKKAGK